MKTFLSILNRRQAPIRRSKQNYVIQSQQQFLSAKMSTARLQRVTQAKNQQKKKADFYANRAAAEGADSSSSSSSSCMDVDEEDERQFETVLMVGSFYACSFLGGWEILRLDALKKGNGELLQEQLMLQRHAIDQHVSFVGSWLSEEAEGHFKLGVIDATNYPATCVIDIGELDMQFDSTTKQYEFADSSRRKDVDVAHELNLPGNASSGGGGGGRRQLSDGYAYEAEGASFRDERVAAPARIGKRQATQIHR